MSESKVIHRNISKMLKHISCLKHKGEMSSCTFVWANGRPTIKILSGFLHFVV